MKIRKALIPDVKNIHKLVNHFADKELMLPRSLNALYENVRDYFVCEKEGALVGVCALHVMWEDLAEIKSLAVAREEWRQGTGTRLVQHCLDDARLLGVNRVLSLTYVPDFFVRFGFAMVDKASLPQKTWGDCLHCPKFPECDEQAVLLDLREER